jgi:hypothetical protein
MGSGNKNKKPKDRNLGQEYKQTVQAQIDVMPQILAAREQYDPQTTALNLQSLRQALAGQQGIASELAPQMSQADFALQQEAIQRDPILRLLQGQATNELAMGGELSDEERIAANEASAGKFAGSGMLASNKSILDRVLMRGDYAENRKANRRGFALQTLGATAGAGGAGRSLLSQLMNPSSAMGQVPQNQFNPESQYASDLYNTNYNSAMSQYNSSKNNRAGIMGSLIGGVTGMFNFGGNK